jgi:hypothetical protein
MRCRSYVFTLKNIVFPSHFPQFSLRIWIRKRYIPMLSIYSSNITHVCHHEIRFKITDQEDEILQEIAYQFYKRGIINKPNIQALGV